MDHRAAFFGWTFDAPKHTDVRSVQLRVIKNPIEAIAQQALATDPMIADPATFTIGSHKGVIHIEGAVHRDVEKQRIGMVVVTALQHMGLKCDRVANDLRMSHLAGAP